VEGGTPTSQLGDFARAFTLTLAGTAIQSQIGMMKKDC